MVDLEGVRLPLFPGLERVCLAHFGGQSREVRAQRHAHGQPVRGLRHVGRPLARLVFGQLVVDGPPILWPIEEPVAHLDAGRKAGPHAEGAKVLGLHALGPELDEPLRVAVDPGADDLLDAKLLVDLEARFRTDSLDEDLCVDLLAFFRVDALVAYALDLVHDASHQVVVAREEVDVGDTKDGLLRDLGEGPLGVRVHSVRTPDVEAHEIVHLREGIQQDRRGHRRLLAPHQPRGALRPAEVPGAAEHVALLAPVLDERPHVLDGERAVAVERADLACAQVVVDLVEGAVLQVAAELVLPGEVDHVGEVQEAGPGADEAHHHHAAVPLLLVAPKLVGRHVLHGVRPVLGHELLHLAVEHAVLVEVVLPGVLPHHVEEGVPRGPRLVVELSDLEGNRLPRQAVVDVVRPPLGLQLRELVRGLDPGVAAEVFVGLHAYDVRPPPDLHVDHGLNRAKSCTEDKDRVIILLGRTAEALDANHGHDAWDLVSGLQDSLVSPHLGLQNDVCRVLLEHGCQYVLNLTYSGAGLDTERDGLLAVAQDNCARSVRI
mmetsp:Transcript_48169/g.148681  ORF Transcript_48169/g.148681 Transcript_48169/m.148681 type:complete len:547 (+) Transcript_48169:382-2022(+)